MRHWRAATLQYAVCLITVFDIKGVADTAASMRSADSWPDSPRTRSRWSFRVLITGPQVFQRTAVFCS
jgi:hypothetical protein